MSRLAVLRCSPGTASAAFNPFDPDGERITMLAEYQAEGKPVFSIEYLIRTDLIEQYVAAAFVADHRLCMPHSRVQPHNCSPRHAPHPAVCRVTTARPLRTAANRTLRLHSQSQRVLLATVFRVLFPACHRCPALGAFPLKAGTTQHVPFRVTALGTNAIVLRSTVGRATLATATATGSATASGTTTATATATAPSATAGTATATATTAATAAPTARASSGIRHSIHPLSSSAQRFCLRRSASISAFFADRTLLS